MTTAGPAAPRIRLSVGLLQSVALFLLYQASVAIKDKVISTLTTQLHASRNVILDNAAQNAETSFDDAGQGGAFRAESDWALGMAKAALDERDHLRRNLVSRRDQHDGSHRFFTSRGDAMIVRTPSERTTPVIDDAPGQAAALGEGARP